MRFFYFYEQNENGTSRRVSWSEEEVLDFYFSYWSNQMRFARKEKEISKEKCIEEWKAIYCAKEVE